MSDIDSMLTQTQAQNRELVKRDVNQARGYFRDLAPRTESYVFPDGLSRLMFTLSGTIPVTYKNATYNIPITIYLSSQHPMAPPFVFVRPTADMRISQSQYVDNTGRVYLPYLAEWKRDRSDLYGLISILAGSFGEKMPVFASRSRDTSQPHVNNQNPNRPGMPMPQPGFPASSSASNLNRAPYPGATPYPPYPNYAQNATQGQPPSYPANNAVQPPPVPPPYSQFSNTGTSSTINADHIRMSLVSAIEDKLRRKVREIVSERAAELQAVKTVRDDLNRGKLKLDDLTKKLQAEQENTERCVMHYQDKTVAMDKILSTAKRSDEMNIDDAIDTTAPLYRQLLNAFAADNAMDDSIYYIGEALKDRSIGIQDYLQYVRRLSRQQFKLRATMTKCREQAGLQPV